VETTFEVGVQGLEWTILSVVVCKRANVLVRMAMSQRPDEMVEGERARHGIDDTCEMLLQQEYSSSVEIGM
jgi:hypothetical protein